MTYNKQAIKAYQQAQVNTTDQLSLVTMFYEGAIRFLKQGEQFIEQKKIERAHHYIVRCQDIITELICSLDVKSTNPVVINLLALYEYMYRTLVTANFKKDKQLLLQIRSHFENLLEGWHFVAQQRKKENSNINSNINPQTTNQSIKKLTSIYG